MPVENRVSIQLSVEEKTRLNNAVKEINTVLKPYLQSVSANDKMNLPKLSESNIPFVMKVLSYCETEPRFINPYTDVNEYKTDIRAYEELNELLRQINPIISQLEDTAFLCGSEAYVSALAYYNSVKLAAKMDVPGAKPVLEDLKIYFHKSPRKETTATNN